MVRPLFSDHFGPFSHNVLRFFRDVVVATSFSSLSSCRRRCRGRRPSWQASDCSAHSSMMGVVTKGEFLGSLSHMTFWRVRDVGIWGFSTSAVYNPIISHMVVADTRLGFFWAAVGADPTEHLLVEQTITLSDSVFVGRSASKEGR